jgi:hypothetical protein
VPYQKTLNFPHFPSAGQPENMRKRAQGAHKGKAGAGMSGNKQEQLENHKNKPSSWKSAAIT